MNFIKGIQEALEQQKYTDLFWFEFWSSPDWAKSILLEFKNVLGPDMKYVMQKLDSYRFWLFPKGEKNVRNY